MVTDARHLLDLSPDVPTPAARLTEFLGDIVRAATSGDVGAAWTSAVPCRRGPGNHRCPGRVVVQRVDDAAAIRWRCGRCGDEGSIHDWSGTPLDLRAQDLSMTEPSHDVVIDDDPAAVLRQVLLLDPDCERAVFRIRIDNGRAVLSVTGAELEQLMDGVAAEANHESNRRRQRRLDDAFEALNDAAHTLSG